MTSQITTPTLSQKLRDLADALDAMEKSWTLPPLSMSLAIQVTQYGDDHELRSEEDRIADTKWINSALGVAATLNKNGLFGGQDAATFGEPYAYTDAAELLEAETFAGVIA